MFKNEVKSNIKCVVAGGICNGVCDHCHRPCSGYVDNFKIGKSSAIKAVDASLICIETEGKKMADKVDKSIPATPPTIYFLSKEMIDGLVKGNVALIFGDNVFVYGSPKKSEEPHEQKYDPSKVVKEINAAKEAKKLEEQATKEKAEEEKMNGKEKTDNEILNERMNKKEEISNKMVIKDPPTLGSPISYKGGDGSIKVTLDEGKGKKASRKNVLGRNPLTGDKVQFNQTTTGGGPDEIGTFSSDHYGIFPVGPTEVTPATPAEE